MKPTYEELEQKCALQQSKLTAINELMGVVEKASDIAKAGIEELELQLEESQREFRAADATIHNLELKLTDMAVQLANAESKCRELAAENAELKESEREFNEYCRQECESAGDTWVDDFTETPATDAFLAEVRAQGVDVARDALIKFVEDEVGPNTNVPGLIRGAEVCVSIAAKLRKGAAL